MKCALISFSREGFLLGEKLGEGSGGELSFLHYPRSGFDMPTAEFVRRLWDSHDALVFISSAGIATRLCAPLLDHKTKDPAVLCMDDLGRYVIPILSGHIGGGNKLAERISQITGAIAVITTATDIRGIQAPDIYAMENGLRIEENSQLTRVTAMMVDGRPLGFYGRGVPPIDYPGLVRIDESQIEGCSLPGLVLVSNSLDLKLPKVPHVIMRPSNVNIGIGCRKGVSGESIIKFLSELLREQGLSSLSVGKMATVDVKKHEPGIREAARFFGCQLKVFGLDEIRAVQDRFPKSEFVEKAIGVHSVSQPAAYLLGGKIIVSKARKDGITISVAVEVDVDE